MLLTIFPQFLCLSLIFYEKLLEIFLEARDERAGSLYLKLSFFELKLIFDNLAGFFPDASQLLNLIFYIRTRDQIIMYFVPKENHKICY